MISIQKHADNSVLLCPPDAEYQEAKPTDGMILPTLTSPQLLLPHIVTEPDTMQPPPVPAPTPQKLTMEQLISKPAVEFQAMGLSKTVERKHLQQQQQSHAGSYSEQKPPASLAHVAIFDMQKDEAQPTILREVMQSQTIGSHSTPAGSTTVSNLSLSIEQREQLWWRAFETFSSRRAFCGVSYIEKAWITAMSRTKCHVKFCQDEIVAAKYATKLLEVLQNIKRVGAQTKHIEFEEILPITSKIQDILEVMQKNLEFKTGAFAWVGLCQAISVCK